MNQKIYEQVSFILQNTKDGGILDPFHLKLLEMGVNGYLNEQGKQELKKLYDNVNNGYKKPFLLGVENITVDLDGYIYYKNQMVEHYKHPYDLNNKGDLLELKERCEILEKHNIEINTINVLSNWEKYKNLK